MNKWMWKLQICPKTLNESEANAWYDNIFEKIVQSQGTYLPLFLNDILHVKFAHYTESFHALLHNNILLAWVT